MPSNFDKFAEKLQREIIKKEIEDHNEKIVELFHNPQNWGKPPKEEITVFEEHRGGAKNDFMGLYLKIESNIIVKANFLTDGCGVMVATGSQTTLLIEGQSIDYAENLTPENLDKSLDGLPEDEIHCADFAIEILQNTIKKYKESER